MINLAHLFLNALLICLILCRFLILLVFSARGFIAQEVLIEEHLRVIAQEGQLIKLFKG